MGEEEVDEVWRVVDCEVEGGEEFGWGGGVEGGGVEGGGGGVAISCFPGSPIPPGSSGGPTVNHLPATIEPCPGRGMEEVEGLSE